ncbi:hypothetical protein [Methylocella sp.]|uniref:hypothetical protein n=1 Tax=Methylocella sp. TaxID=1978226 RepID=UPI0035B12D1F
MRLANPRLATLRLTISTLALLPILAGAPASAQYGRDGRPPVSGVLPPPESDDPEAYDGTEEAEPGRVCQKMCETDESPCDPVEWKIEDGRCDEAGFDR